ncbi:MULTISPECIES: arylamine N-acetyltransferase family protein [Streptomyces]|uniref:Arylamine N-acetyltransferase n=1 Tax=Streptomyces evansiae TaxID=3075535 RepID=A0ABU2R4D4_9ACTN|nr:MULTISPECIES: arylamine N-acetyltransferase [unclassified Streptomyces]MDT0411563.1 arylamine N-acetyltransferase [Streptomyces sp. DSM 41979]MDT0424553.1 arylamine N-acetyltransferase [Streptomyces sp. DSM 41859]MYQ61613.1 arylamine N-acetyltransferase [Streptomyces sp. SID4926]SCD78388.1 N-hydroxyarylamine O-acetyltransferase [Streptomyces sp. DfronAA-171]
MSISSQSPESGPDLAAYLGRLGIGAAPSALPPTLATLRTVQRAQLLAIPFENLDPVRGIVPALEVPALEDKLVRRRRGGYCFELNGLLSAALTALGFTVRPLAGRVVLGVGDEGWASRPATHLALAVDTEEGTHLADAGFGALGALPGPLPLRDGAEHAAHGRRHRLDRHEHRWSLAARTPDGWETQYVLSTAPAPPIDREVANWYVATHPRSPFTRRLVVNRTSPDAHRALLGDPPVNGTTERAELTTTYADGRSERRTLTGWAEVAAVLEGELGLGDVTPRDVG